MEQFVKVVLWQSQTLRISRGPFTCPDIKLQVEYLASRLCNPCTRHALTTPLASPLAAHESFWHTFITSRYHIICQNVTGPSNGQAHPEMTLGTFFSNGNWLVHRQRLHIGAERCTQHRARRSYRYGDRAFFQVWSARTPAQTIWSVWAYKMGYGMEWTQYIEPHNPRVYFNQSIWTDPIHYNPLHSENSKLWASFESEIFWQWQSVYSRVVPRFYKTELRAAFKEHFFFLRDGKWYSNLTSSPIASGD